MSERQEKVSHEIAKAAALFLEKVSERNSLITVTRVNISPDLRNSTIYITVLPESQEESALFFCKRRMSDFKKYIKENLRMKIIPFFDVEIDRGERNRQTIENISQNI